MTDDDIVEVIAKAVRWFDFDEPGDTASSLGRVILAQLRAKDYEVVERGIAPSYETCVIHLAPRASEEDPSICWEYDGKDDCLFTSNGERRGVVLGPGVHYGGAVSIIRGTYLITDRL